MTENRAAPWLSLAQVMAHCGGSPRDTLHYVTGAIANAPDDPRPYSVLADLWGQQRQDLDELFQSTNSLQAVVAQSYISFLKSDMDASVMTLGGVVGAHPAVAWAKAPWFNDPRFLEMVGAEALAEAVMRTMDYGRELDTPSVRDGTWRKLGNPDETMAAFQRALALDPTNWSLFLDMADLAAEQGDYGRALALIEQGLKHEPAETTLRAAGAAYRARLTGSPDDLRELMELAPHMPNDSYRSLLVNLACAGPGLPAELVAEAHSFQGR